MAKNILPTGNIKNVNHRQQYIELLNNLEEENFKNGFVLTSPNETKYKIVVDDTGTISTEEV
jgi:hypothetical protein